VTAIPTLTTERLLLRPFRDADLDAYAELCADAEVMRWIGDGETMNRGGAWRHMAMLLGHWDLRGYGPWALERRDTGEVVGRGGLWEPDGWPDTEVGWTLRRGFWGNGFATEAGRATLDWAFGELGRDRIIAVIEPGNTRSIAVAERLGMEPDGHFDHRGRRHTLYALSRP
jgi:RimJ/RimL family protein N-acetyltransferase